MPEKKTCRVKVNVQVGDKAFEAGQVVELEDETAKASPWTFEIQESEDRSQNKGFAFS